MTHRDIVIEEKEYPEQKPEWKSKDDPLSIQFPEADEPGTAMHRLKCGAHGESRRARTAETTPICHSRRRDEGKRHAVISTETSRVPIEERGVGNVLEEECGNKHQEGKDDRNQ